MKTFEVINPGMLTTIQDLGRIGYQKFGLAVSGSADYYAHRIANILLSNKQNVAVLEITLFGLKIKALQNTVISITGANLNPTVNDKPVPMWSTIKIEKNDIIHFKGGNSGCRAYLAVAGGIDTPIVLGSRSTDIIGEIGGLDGRSLKKGDVINANFTPLSLDKYTTTRRLPSYLIPDYTNEIEARVILGPQAEDFTSQTIKKFFSSHYTVSNELDRMACRLNGPKLEHKHGADINSEGLFHGAIQIPKNGLPIVFLVGRQSIGGYTKIGGVISTDLPKLAQVKTGDSIRFREVTIEKAHELLNDQEKVFKILSLNIGG